MRARSKKRERLMRDERVPLVKEILAGHPPCALGIAATSVLVKNIHAGQPPCAAARRVVSNCRGRADCLHERRKRGQGGSLVKRENLAALCAPCNSAIESDAEVARLAREAGLVVRRGDPEWEGLGNG